MDTKPKAKKIIPIAAALFACVIAVLYYFHSRLVPEKSDVSDNRIESTAPSGVDVSMSGGLSVLPEEDDEVSTEMIDLQSLPFSVYFRKLTFVLKDCMASKSKMGQPEPFSVQYDDIETNEKGDLLNDYIYLHVTFSIKNESSEVIATNINCARLIVGRKSDDLAVDIAEMCAMNRESQTHEQREYYHWSFEPGVEEEFTVSFILRDSYLSDDYALNYFYSPFGRTDTIQVDGKSVSVSDAKILHLNDVIRREGEEYKDGEATQTPINSYSIPSSESSAMETISFWQGGEVSISYETAQSNDGEEYTRTIFKEPVYLRDFDQLKAFSDRYDLESRFPLFELCSPFDGSKPKYIKIDERINYYFPIPGYENCDLEISWDWGETNFWTDEAILEEYKVFSNHPVLKDDTEIFKGKTSIVCHHNKKKKGGESDSYTLDWAYQGVYLIIDQIPEEIRENDSQLFIGLIQSIQETSYVVK